MPAKTRTTSTLSQPGPRARSNIRGRDRRVARTYRGLHEALIALILERGWQAISVQDICTRADIGRSTFYVHFADKEELLVSGFEQFTAELRAHVAKEGGESLAFVRPLVEHVRAHQPVYRALVGKGAKRVVERRLLEVICEFIEPAIAAHVRPGPRRNGIVRYAAGGFLELLTLWLEKRNGLDESAIATLLHQLTSAVVVQAKRAQ
jgi:AcrR family transcriptional regulator